MADSHYLELPNDVLVEIVTQLKRVSDTTQDLASCSRVNRAWQEAITPLLYGNVTLNVFNTTSFCDGLVKEKYAAVIRSISVSLATYEVTEPVTQLVPLFLTCKSLSLCKPQQRSYLAGRDRVPST